MLNEAKSRVARGVGPKGGERLTHHFLYVELNAELQLEASAALSRYEVATRDGITTGQTLVSGEIRGRREVPGVPAFAGEHLHGDSTISQLINSGSARINKTQGSPGRPSLSGAQRSVTTIALVPDGVGEPAALASNADGSWGRAALSHNRRAGINERARFWPAGMLGRRSQSAGQHRCGR